MKKFVSGVAVLFCLGLWSQGATAGGTALTTQFILQSINVNVPGNQTTVTATFTATLTGPPAPAMLTTTFTNTDGFASPVGIGPLNPFMTPGACTPTGMCMFPGLDFTMPGTTFGVTTFTANTTLADGTTIHQTASFSVPEPGALGLLSLGLVALVVVVRRKSVGITPA